MWWQAGDRQACAKPLSRQSLRCLHLRLVCTFVVFPKPRKQVCWRGGPNMKWTLQIITVSIRKSLLKTDPAVLYQLR